MAPKAVNAPEALTPERVRVKGWGSGSDLRNTMISLNSSAGID